MRVQGSGCTGKSRGSHGGVTGEGWGQATHAFVDTTPHVEVLASAVRLARGVLLDARDAPLVRRLERRALGPARLLQVWPVVYWVFVVGPVAALG